MLGVVCGLRFGCMSLLDGPYGLRGFRTLSILWSMHNQVLRRSVWLLFDGLSRSMMLHRLMVP